MSATNDRAARAVRARQEGNARASASKPAVLPTQPRAKTAVTVIPDSAARQSQAALARLAESELQRAKIAERAAAKPSKPARAATTATARTAAQRKPAAKAKTKAEPVAPVQISDVVHSMNLEHVQCRDFGHSWRPFTARWIAAYNQYESQLVCARCNTLRTRFLSRTGEQLSGGYDYAEGYLVKGMGRLTGSDRDVIRLASIQAVLIPDSADESSS